MIASSPLISIIMPAYNAARYIEASIKCVLEQTYDHWELILINDGSTDTTAEIALKYSLSDARIKVINQSNSRLAAARNAGLSRSQGEWIAFLDADDIWPPNKLESQARYMATYPGVSVFYTDGWIFYNDDIENNLVPYPTITGKLFKAEDIYRLLYQENYVPVLSIVAKKELVDAVGPQDSKYYGCEDLDYSLRMALAGAAFYGISEKLFYYRRHSHNMSNDDIRMKLSKALVYAKNFHSDQFKSDSIVRQLRLYVDTLLLELVNNRRNQEVFELIHVYQDISGFRHYHWSKLAVRLLGKQSVTALKILNRVTRY